jgi:hypothetical protein
MPWAEGSRFGRWSLTPSTARTGGSSVPFRSWVSPTCFRSRSRPRGGTRRARSAPCGRPPWQPDGEATGNPGEGGARLPGRAQGGLVGAGSGGRSLRHRAGEEGDRGQHRSRKAARPRLLVPDHQPTRPSDRSEREAEGALAPASVAEVVRLYGLRMWGEQSYKQVKPVLGWSDLAIRRHWQLACLAFSDLPPPADLMALLEWVFSGRGLYLYAR